MNYQVGNTLEDKKRVALKLALEFLDVYCRDRFEMESLEYPTQWKNFCLTKNTIIEVLRQELKKEVKSRKRKEKAND